MLKGYIEDHFGNRVQTWMALADMTGAPVEAMGENVKRADMVIMCVSSAYEKSKYCISEACMAMEQNKNRLVLIMEQGYDPTRNSKMYPIVAEPMRINCYNDKLLTDNLEKIYKEIEKGIQLGLLTTTTNF